MNITHDISLRSIAFPFIGTGVLKYPPLEVMKALIDACSLFREKDSPLKTVYIVVWDQDSKTEKVIKIVTHASTHIQNEDSTPKFLKCYCQKSAYPTLHSINSSWNKIEQYLFLRYHANQI